MADILVIDDDEAFRYMVCKLLTRAGYKVLDCQNGKIGIDLLRKNSVPLIITDLIMPDQEGIETIIQLRRDFPQVKIIAMSGGGRGNSEIYLDSAMRLGATRCFSKPFDNDAFLDSVKELLT